MLIELFLLAFGLAVLAFGFNQLFSGGGDSGGKGHDSLRDLRKSRFVHTSDDTLEEMGYKKK
ncbi:hypothetical protein ACFL67_04295 [candidate division KSB1 bacterium]